MENNDATAAEKKPAEKAPTNSKKGIGAGPRLLIVGCVLAVGCLMVLLLGGTVLAFFSNKNVPVFSDVVETVENTVASESVTDEAIQDDMNDLVFSILADMAGDETGYTKAEAEEMVNEKFEADNFRYEVDVAAEMVDMGELELDMIGYTRKVDEQSVQKADVSGTYSMQGADMDFAGELRYKDGTAYVMISELPEVLAQSMNMDASSLTEQWFSMDGSTSTDTVSGLGLDQGLTSSATSIDMDYEDLQKLQDLIYSDEMADMLTRVDDEVIEGVRTNCFEMTLNQENLTNISKKGAELWEQEYDEDTVDLIDENSEAVLQVCSGRKDGNIYKVDFEMSSDDGTNLSMNIKFWDYDEVEDEVEVPQDAVSFEDFITQMYMQQLGLTTEEQEQMEQFMQEYQTEDFDDVNWDNLYQ